MQSPTVTSALRHYKSLQELHEARDSLLAFRTQVQELENSAASSTDAHAKQLADSNARIEELKQQVNSSQRQCDEISGQLASVQAQRDELQQSLSEAHERQVRGHNPCAGAPNHVHMCIQGIDRCAHHRVHYRIQLMKTDVMLVCSSRSWLCQSDAWQKPRLRQQSTKSDSKRRERTGGSYMTQFR